MCVRSMGTKRKHLGAAVFQGCVYAGKYRRAKKIVWFMDIGLFLQCSELL